MSANNAQILYAPDPAVQDKASPDRTILSKQDIQSFSRDIQILLATNGTLTRILSVVIDEEVEVEVFEQTVNDRLPGFSPSGEPIDGRLLQRKVLLRGKLSGKPFVAAESSIAIDLLPPPLVANLKQTNRPIGEIIATSCLELFKEAPEVWMGDPPHWSLPAVNHTLRQKTIGRRYRMIIAGRPAIVVSEYFPLDLF